METSMDDFIRFQIKLNILMSSAGRQIQKNYEKNLKKLKWSVYRYLREVPVFSPILTHRTKNRKSDSENTAKVTYTLTFSQFWLKYFEITPNLR